MLLHWSKELFFEIKNYGAYIYALAAETHQEGSDVSKTVIALLYRKALETIDGISILMESGCVSASWPLIRTHSEIYAQIRVMIEDETDSSARAYLFCARKENQIVYQDMLNERQISQEEYDKIIEEDNEAFSMPEYQEFEQKWNEFRKKNQYPQWYSLTQKHAGKRITKLLKCIDIDLGKVYHHTSCEAHGLGVLGDLFVVDGKTGLHLLRRPEKFAGCVNYCIATQCEIYMLFIRKILELQDEENLDEWFKRIDALMDGLKSVEKNNHAISQG